MIVWNGPGPIESDWTPTPGQVACLIGLLVGVLYLAVKGAL